ncbi:hypothetical protein IFVP5_C1370110 [Vibrio parahaemolyticus]
MLYILCSITTINILKQPHLKMYDQRQKANAGTTNKLNVSDKYILKVT